jgi:hypothetical protein
MKKVAIFTMFMMIMTMVSGQKSIDNLFDKYAGKDGFTTVTINGNLLKLMGNSDGEDKDSDLPASITEIRILAQEDKDMKVDNFYDMVIRDIDLGSYEEFMRVKDSEQNLRMLVKTEGKRFREFLLIVGGKDNAIIQIKGDMSFDEAKRFSDDAKKDHLDILKDHK